MDAKGEAASCDRQAEDAAERDFVDSAEQASAENAQMPRRDVLHFKSSQRKAASASLLVLFDAPAADANEGEAGRQANPPEKQRRGIAFSSHACTRATGDGCVRCMTACPTHAIRMEAYEDRRALPRIDHDSCNGCGICISICDAYSSLAYATEDYARRLLRHATQAAADGCAKSICLCCERGVPEGAAAALNVEPLPCLSALSPEFLTWLVAHDVELVLYHEDSLCVECPIGGRFGGALWKRAQLLVEEWTGKRIRRIETFPEKHGLIDRLAEPDRRTLFSSVFEAAGDVASGRYREGKSTVVEDFLTRREQMRAQSRTGQNAGAYLDEGARRKARRGHFARQNLLEEAMRRDPRIKKRIGGFSAPESKRENEAQA